MQQEPAPLKNDKNVEKLPVRGMLGIMFLSLLATCLVYWYENDKFAQKIEKLEQSNKTHSFKKINERTKAQFLKRADSLYFTPNDTITKH